MAFTAKTLKLPAVPSIADLGGGSSVISGCQQMEWQVSCFRNRSCRGTRQRVFSAAAVGERGTSLQRGSHGSLPRLEKTGKRSLGAGQDALGRLRTVLCKSASEGRELETSSSTTLESEAATSSTSSQGATSAPASTSEFPAETPSQIGGPYRSLALSSVGIAVGLFMMTRVAGAGPDLGSLARSSLPYDEAISNGKPTLVEFYADWCEVCREMAKDVYGVELQYRDEVNFVMLNIDNPKWAPELAEFGVDGIPHFSFLDGEGNEEGYAVGRLPPRILAENLAALARGDTSVPFSNVVNEASSTENRRTAPAQVSPRAHS